MSKYAKAIAGFIGALVNVLYYYNVGHPNAYVSSVIGILTVAGIFVVPNTTVTK